MQVQKLGGPPLKFFTPTKFWVDFTQLPIFIANISGTSQDIQNQKDMWLRTISSLFTATSALFLSDADIVYRYVAQLHSHSAFYTQVCNALYVRYGSY